MDSNELENEVRDLIIRVEGTINVLHRPDVIRADRKLQGIRDKLRHLLYKAVPERKPKDTPAKSLVDKIQKL